MNILILSAGSRNKIVQYFKEVFKNQGNIIAADASKMAPAIYEADRYYIIPRIDSPNYLSKILEICEKEKISAVISLIDPEVSLLAKNKQIFTEKNVTVIGSEIEQCDISLNKMKFHDEIIKKGFLSPKTYDDLEKFKFDLKKAAINFPVIVKPKTGSASLNVIKVNDLNELNNILSTYQDSYIIQQFINGQEIGVDVYIDMLSNDVVSLFSKKKTKMRAGETDKSVSFIDNRLIELIENFAVELKYKGPIDIDLFEVNGVFYISEVNPRFGGGYPHAHELGVNHVQLIFNNLNGLVNKKSLIDYTENIIMAKYNEVMIIN